MPACARTISVKPPDRNGGGMSSHPVLIEHRPPAIGRISRIDPSRFQMPPARSAREGIIVPICLLISSIISVQIGSAIAKGLFPVTGAPGTAASRLIFAAIILIAIWRSWRARLTLQDARSITIYGVRPRRDEPPFLHVPAEAPAGDRRCDGVHGPLGGCHVLLAAADRFSLDCTCGDRTGASVAGSHRCGSA